MLAYCARKQAHGIHGMTVVVAADGRKFKMEYGRRIVIRVDGSSDGPVDDAGVFDGARVYRRDTWIPRGGSGGFHFDRFVICDDDAFLMQKARDKDSDPAFRILSDKVGPYYAEGIVALLLFYDKDEMEGVTSVIREMSGQARHFVETRASAAYDPIKVMKEDLPGRYDYERYYVHEDDDPYVFEDPEEYIGFMSCVLNDDVKHGNRIFISNSLDEAEACNQYMDFSLDLLVP
jgi:hypothetical protein